MYILLKFDYAKFGLSNLCLSKVIEENPLGVGYLPPPIQEGLKKLAKPGDFVFIKTNESGYSNVYAKV